MSSEQDVDGVAAYRKNGWQVEGLSRPELNDMLERFPSSSDAFMKASQQLSYYDKLNEQAPCYPEDVRDRGDESDE